MHPGTIDRITRAPWDPDITLGDIALYRGSETPCVAVELLMVTCVIHLHPEAELKVVLKGLVRPGDLLIGIQ